MDEARGRARPVEKKLASARLHKASHAFEAMLQIAGEIVLFLFLHSQNRLVHDRISNYLQKYLPAAQEITDKDVIAAGHDPHSKDLPKPSETWSQHDWTAASARRRRSKVSPNQPDDHRTARRGLLSPLSPNSAVPDTHHAQRARTLTYVLCFLRSLIGRGPCLCDLAHQLVPSSDSLMG